MSITYRSAGVDIDAAETATKSIAREAKSTFNAHVLNDIGLFAGFYEINLQKYPQPVVVTSIDGVGTKLKIAFMMGVHDTVGQDLVNHCVNDIMTCGADPAAFTDYIGTQKLSPEILAEIIRGMAKACRENECALIGGETAEMPGFYAPGEYDLAGSIIGLVNRPDIIDGSRIAKGHLLIGIASNGLHTNGYSLARKVLLEIKKIDLNVYEPELARSWGEELLRVHKSYRSAIMRVRSIPGVDGISHITGGGIVGNTQRLLRSGLELAVDWSAWQIPPEFRLLQQYGDIEDEEMRRVFNLGIGLVFVVSPQAADKVKSELEAIGEKPVFLGEVK
ncbi:MAG: phosphoribosylformylglycinamidine cyclo-ligase [candidate division KSB1 bacterium]|nr:phosphoribosylformylglycinamidine cyclo-ligase [candidate division KSB1 bacterium]